MFGIKRGVGRVGAGGPSQAVGQIEAVLTDVLLGKEEIDITCALEQGPGEIGLAHHLGQESQMPGAAKG